VFVALTVFDGRACRRRRQRRDVNLLANLPRCHVDQSRPRVCCRFRLPNSIRFCRFRDAFSSATSRLCSLRPGNGKEKRVSELENKEKNRSRGRKSSTRRRYFLVTSWLRSVFETCVFIFLGLELRVRRFAPFRGSLTGKNRAVLIK